MTWLARLSLLLLILQLATALTIQNEEQAKEEENDDEDEADKNEEASSNMPIEQPIVQNAMVRTPESVTEFLNQEKGWINVFMKHMLLYTKWGTKIAGVAVNAHFYGMVASVVFRIVKGLHDDKRDAFDKIRNKIDQRISYHINKDKIDKARNIFDNQIAAITAKMHWREGTNQAGYQYEDLLELRQYLPDFLPHDPTVVYDPEWFQLMGSYLILYKNFYNGLISSGRIHKCVFVHDWNTMLKQSLIKSIKRLTYSYFSHLQKTNAGALGIGTAYLTFEDHIPVEKVTYTASFKNIKSQVLHKLSKDVAKIMFDNIGKAYNKLLVDFKPRSLYRCGNPSHLTIEDITFDYPKKCYGRARDGDNNMQECDLPCGKFENNSPYCVYFHGREPEDKLFHLFTKNNRLMNCEGSGPDYWRTCAKIERLPNIAEWDEAITNKQRSRMG